MEDTRHAWEYGLYPVGSEGFQAGVGRGQICLLKPAHFRGESRLLFMLPPAKFLLSCTKSLFQ